MTEIHIKNMVCPRCIKAVKEVLTRLGIDFDSVSLGCAVLKEELTKDLHSLLQQALLDEGFELIDDRQASRVERIRLCIIEWARLDGEHPSLSEYLQSRFLREYSSLSKLFSQTNSVSVERYAVLQRIEYAKELLSYGEKSISEISWALGYSSPAHFSSQFKKETGMTPRQFMSLLSKERTCIDKI